MGDKKYQVFISSTYTDLVQAREKISKQILTLYHFPIGMEMFSAGDDDQWTVITNTIDKSDYYIIILGHRYGSLAEDGLSFTEKEYDYAKSKGIPIMAFIKDRDVPTSTSERETNYENIEKLDKFIEKAKLNKMCDFWKNEDELAAKVTAALFKAFYSTPRIGWVRGDSMDTTKMLEEIAFLKSENQKLKEEKAKLINAKQDDENKHYAVQPWFHVTSISRMGGNAPNKLIVLNDASPHIRINEVLLCIDSIDKYINLDYKYLKKDDKYVETGKCFAIEIPHNEEFFDKEGVIKIKFNNLYNKEMVSTSPKIRFNSKDSDVALLNVIAEGFLYKPFNNTIEG
ncbi:DUF4062 domain-containing protein [Lysinibacillus capsici]|uniref:DUF4062 domain-containing protein n=1 Tax=Lysinibacillus capsici TaxID=2115968 RepID=UPI003D00FAE7